MTILGCVPSYEQPEPKIEGEFLVHVVRARGETVKQLAQWYTGSDASVQAIRRANKGIGSGELKNGRRVFIPLELVTRTEPPVLATPTPAAAAGKLVIITDATPRPVQAKQKSTADSGRKLERFDEEIGPGAAAPDATVDSDVMVLQGAPTVPPPSSAPAAAFAPQEPPAEVDAAPQREEQAPSQAVADFESEVDKLLLKEQAELDKLQRELATTSPKTK
jgi:hypothetical protein